MRRTLILAAALLTAVAACGAPSSGGGATAIKIMAPAAPGGGWDTTSRTAEQAFKSADPNLKVEVYNVPGAGGTIGLTQLVGEKGNGNLLMTMGLVMVGAIEQNKSQVTLAETTPIAKLTEEYEIVVVPANSPFQNLQDLANRLEDRPRQGRRGRRFGRRHRPHPGRADGQGVRGRPEAGQLHRPLRRR